MGNVSIQASSGYKLTLKGEGVAVDRDISTDLAMRIIAMVLGEGAPQASSKPLENTAAVQPNNGLRTYNSGAVKKSLREYFIEVDAKKNPQKILAIANYLTSVMGQSTFSIADIKPQFKAANEPVPGNLHRDFQLVSQYGWIAPDHEERKKFYITQTGLDALANGFE